MGSARLLWFGLCLASYLGVLGCGGASTSSVDAKGDDDASSGSASIGGTQAGTGANASGGAGSAASGGSADGGAKAGGAGAGGGSIVTGGFIEGEILGELRRYDEDAYTTTHGAAQGYLIVGGRLSPDSYQDMFFIALPNQTGTHTLQVFWFGNNGIYDGPCSVHVTGAGPDVGDIVKATFSGVLTRSGTDEMYPLTNGRFELPRIQ